MMKATENRVWNKNASQEQQIITPEKVRTEISANGNRDLSEQFGTKEWLDKYFPVVSIGLVPLNSKIFEHSPATERQRIFNLGIRKALKSGLPDFRAQVMDPSIDKNGNIYYCAGSQPAVGISPAEWQNKFENFLPEMNSRMGSFAQRLVLAGVVLRNLVHKQNIAIPEAWSIVCDESAILGGYSDSADAMEKQFNCTGTHKVGKFYDLANTGKFTCSNGTYTVFKGNAFLESTICPLAHFERVHNPEKVAQKATGWCVMDVVPVKMR